MSFDSNETSVGGGHPSYLYLFTRGTATWSYTDADEQISFGGVNYAPVSMANNGFTYGGDTNTDDLQITISSTATFLQLFIAQAPSDAIYLSVRKFHTGDTDAIIVWTGVITGINRQKVETAIISGTTLANTLGGNGLRLAWSKNCPHCIYDSECKVNPATFALGDHVASINGAQFSWTNPSHVPDHWLDGGWVEWSVAGGLERRGIQTQVGTVITVLGSTYPLTVGTTITLYPGCDETTQTCNDKFNNLANCGAFRFMPGVSPFNGNPAF